MKCKLSKTLILLFSFLLCIGQVLAQETKRSNKKYRLSLTAEPLNFAFKGYSFWLGLSNKRMAIGLTTFSSYSTNHVLFETNEALDIKLQNGTALWTRYFFLPRKKHKPFAGFLIGDEVWRVRKINDDTQTNLLRNMFLTPQVGYEFNLWKDKLIINPNLRFILPFNKRGEEEIDGIKYPLKSFGIIPAFDIGFCHHF